MLKRTISAVVGIPLFLVFVFLGGVFFTVAVMILSFLTSVELGRMLKRIGINEMLSFLYTAALLFPLLLSFEPSWLPHFFVMFVFSGTIIALSRYPELDFADLGANFFSILYVAFGFSHFILLRQMEQGMLLVTYAFTIIWLTDIGAFFIGTHFGKRPFFTHISPKKTTEGAIGGLAAGILAGCLFCILANRLGPLDNMGFLIILTPFLSAIGQIGDLFESALKRQAKMKDSSQLIPGHGGVLDRFDSALWVIPLLYHILQIRNTIFM
ncbi:MAG: phosphatidate cytidylyltransferase [Clostridiales bacterium]|nr:phosphatidate cytidylyltransferase [Clostridiales bacterium]